MMILLSSALVLFASARTWATVAYAENGFPSVEMHFSGRQIDPLSAALGIAGLAAALAVVSVRGVVRRIFGGIVLLMGAGAAVSSYASSRLDSNSVTVLRLVSDTLGRAVESIHVTMTVWPHVSIVAALMLAFSGGIVALRAPSGSAMSQRYDRTPQDKDLTTWQALDRGIDPTV